MFSDEYIYVCAIGVSFQTIESRSFSEPACVAIACFQQTEPRQTLRHGLWERLAGLGPGRGRGLRTTSTLKDEAISCSPFWKTSGIHGNSVFTLVLGHSFSSSPNGRHKEPLFCRGPTRQEWGINESGGKATSSSSPGGI